MDRPDVVFAEGLDRESLEQAGCEYLPQDHVDPHRGLDIAPLPHMVDGMPVVDQQGDPALPWRLRRPPAALDWQVTGGPQLHRVILEGLDHHPDIARGAELAVLALEDRTDDPPGGIAGKGLAAAQVIEDQVGWIVRTRGHRGLVGGVGDGEGPVALVEAQPRRILCPYFRIGRQGGVVRQALEEESDHVEGAGLLPHPVVERSAHAPAGSAGGGGDEVEVGEVQVRGVHEQGEPLELRAGVLGHEEHRPKAVPQRVPQLPRELVEVLFFEPGELAAQDGFHLG
jgi:hypothetical protein